MDKLGTYVVSYYSKDNIFAGKVSLQAKTLIEAQDQFFTWLKRQSVYTHLWNLSFSIEKVESIVY